MLDFQRKRFAFTIREIWFADYPFEVDGCDSAHFNACKNALEMKGFIREEQATLTIDLKQDLDAIWRNMRKTCRHDIDRAKKEGVRITVNACYDKFYELNRSFRRRKGLPLGPETLDFMKNYGTLFVAEFRGQIVAGVLCLQDEHHMRWLIGASRRLDVEKESARLTADANRLTLWEAICHARNTGMEEFDLGGFYVGKADDEEKERINIFKGGFGGKLTMKYNYRRDYSMLYTVSRKVYELTWL
jgi:lipid II:glycine glycyltransferase (peptidoglycan interpeptide bridge formation enzyme)